MTARAPMGSRAGAVSSIDDGHVERHERDTRRRLVGPYPGAITEEQPTDGLRHSVTVDLPFDEAVTRIRSALAEQGFGVPTEIDVAATLKAKLGIDAEPQVILGACNPQLTHRALETDPDIGSSSPATWWSGAAGAGRSSRPSILR